MCMSVPSFREHACAPFEFGVLRATDSCPADVSVDHKFLDALCGYAECHVAEHRVKFLGFIRALGVHVNSPVLPQHAEVKCVIHRVNHYERRFGRGWGQLEIGFVITATVNSP